METTISSPATLESEIAAFGALVGALAHDYPDHGLSFGYIGQVDGSRDDRSWRVFTRYRYASTDYAASLACGDADDIQYSADRALHVRRWVNALNTHVAKGTIRGV